MSVTITAYDLVRNLSKDMRNELVDVLYAFVVQLVERSPVT